MNNSTRKRVVGLALGTALMSTGLGVTAVAAPPGATISFGPSGFVASEVVKVSVDFPTSKPYLTLQAKQPGGSWAVIQKHKPADKNGMHTFQLRVDATMVVRVVDDGSATATSELDLVPAKTTATLDPIVSNASGTHGSASAHFSPARSQQKTELQALTIQTSNTSEVKKSSWHTIATGKEDGSGHTTFALGNPLEVKHSYRAVTQPSGGRVQTVSGTVAFAAKAVTKNTGLSTVYLNTNEGHPVNTRDHYFEGEFSMTASSLLPECTAVKAQPGMTVKGRGHYSWTFPKRSFTVKLDKKTDLCGMGKSKKWALVSNEYDKSLLRNAVASNIGSKLTNMGWTPKSKPVDLYVNGSYRGSFLLIERITIDKDRVDVDEISNGPDDPAGANNVPPNITGGYLLEWDFRKSGDHNVTAGRRGWVAIDEPEDEDDGTGITHEQIHYVNTYLDATDKALFGKGFKDRTRGWRAYIDQKSAVDYYIAQELMKPVDGNMWASVYMYKARNGKLFFGPMWDYDLAAGSAARAGGTANPKGWYLRNPTNTLAKQSAQTWFNRLNDDPTFRAAVRARWKQVAPALRTDDAWIAKQKTILSKSAAANFGKWNVHEHLSTSQVVKGSWPKEVSYLRWWLKTRISWMNSQY